MLSNTSTTQSGQSRGVRISSGSLLPLALSLCFALALWIVYFRVATLEEGQRATQEQLLALDSIMLSWQRLNVSPGNTDALLLRIALDLDIPIELARAVVSAESNWDSTAVSRVGAVGLLQVMPKEHAQLILSTCGSFGSLIEQQCNIEVGLRILRGYYDRYGNWREALLAYNGALHYPSAGRRYLESVAKHLPEEHGLF